MSKKPNIVNEKQTIYEIFRSCRLCGAGGGYKMPIIQNVVNLDDSEIELRTKIKECVNIEIQEDDKMPPLICEWCVDKVNDFYEFIGHCRKTNKKTRLRLGLPLQNKPPAEDCILGVTEQLHAASDSDSEPLVVPKTTSSAKKKVKIDTPLPKPALVLKTKKTTIREPIKIKIEKRSPPPKIETRKRSPTPPRPLRNRKEDKRHSLTERSLAEKRIPEKSSTEKRLPEKRVPEKSLPEKRLPEKRLAEKSQKRLSDGQDRMASRQSKSVKIEPAPVAVKRKTEPPKAPVPAKRVKESPKPEPKKLAPTKEVTYQCLIQCGDSTYKTIQALTSHMRSHTVGFTPVHLACNACEDWFVTNEEARAHTKEHSNGKPYHCKVCDLDYVDTAEYDDHFNLYNCLRFEELPGVKCATCWREYPTKLLHDQHKCMGVDGRPGGKCRKCRKFYALLKNLIKHETACTKLKKYKIDYDVMKSIKPMQIRLVKVDSLCERKKVGEHYDVSTVSHTYGIDKSCYYPYLYRYTKIKSEFSFDKMVTINDEVKKDLENFVHWDSDIESDTEIQNSIQKIDKLSTLSLKTIFSPKFLGKVPRFLRKKTLKMEQPFEGFDNDVNTNIDGLIDSLFDDGIDSESSVRISDVRSLGSDVVGNGDGDGSDGIASNIDGNCTKVDELNDVDKGSEKTADESVTSDKNNDSSLVNDAENGSDNKRDNSEENNVIVDKNTENDEFFRKNVEDISKNENTGHEINNSGSEKMDVDADSTEQNNDVANETSKSDETQTVKDEKVNSNYEKDNENTETSKSDEKTNSKDENTEIDKTNNSNATQSHKDTEQMDEDPEKSTQNNEIPITNTEIHEILTEKVEKTISNDNTKSKQNGDFDKDSNYSNGVENGSTVLSTTSDEDRKLMDELDAQIGESPTKSVSNCMGNNLDNVSEDSLHFKEN